MVRVVAADIDDGPFDLAADERQRGAVAPHKCRAGCSNRPRRRHTSPAQSRSRGADSPITFFPSHTFWAVIRPYRGESWPETAPPRPQGTRAQAPRNPPPDYCAHEQTTWRHPPVRLVFRVNAIAPGQAGSAPAPPLAPQHLRRDSSWWQDVAVARTVTHTALLAA
jgi:hypothetical protein